MHKMCHDQESLIFDKIYRSGMGREGGGGKNCQKNDQKWAHKTSLEEWDH